MRYHQKELPLGCWVAWKTSLCQSLWENNGRTSLAILFLFICLGRYLYDICTCKSGRIFVLVISISLYLKILENEKLIKFTVNKTTLVLYDRLMKKTQPLARKRKSGATKCRSEDNDKEVTNSAFQHINVNMDAGEKYMPRIDRRVIMSAVYPRTLKRNIQSDLKVAGSHALA